jgi:hypothetical protein
LSARARKTIHSRGRDRRAAGSAGRGRLPVGRVIGLVLGLRFKRLPKPLIVTAARTRADALRELDRHSSAVERRTAAQVLELLGLLKPGIDLRAIEGDVAGEQVAGYYDTRRKRLAIVAGSAAADDVASEITLAHELDHALDDQRIGIHDVTSTGADDAATAYDALVEGLATAVMDEYARRFIDPGAALRSAFAAAGPSAAATKKIPPYLLSSILFSYLSGEKFVNRLRSVAHGWKLVNYALRARPPRSTEQVIHPEKYLVDERAVPVAASGLRAFLPRGWKPLARGTVGEFDTDQLLKLGSVDGVAGDAAAGWGGGSYVLWGARGATGRKHSVLVLTWAWDTPLDALQFGRALPAYLTKGLHARGLGGGIWSVGDGFAATRAVGPLRTVLAFAPSAALARRLTVGARLDSAAAKAAGY